MNLLKFLFLILLFPLHQLAAQTNVIAARSHHGSVQLAHHEPDNFGGPELNFALFQPDSIIYLGSNSLVISTQQLTEEDFTAIHDTIHNHPLLERFGPDSTIFRQNYPSSVLVNFSGPNPLQESIDPPVKNSTYWLFLLLLFPAIYYLIPTRA